MIKKQAATFSAETAAAAATVSAGDILNWRKAGRLDGIGERPEGSRAYRYTFEDSAFLAVGKVLASIIGLDAAFFQIGGKRRKPIKAEAAAQGSHIMAMARNRLAATLKAPKLAVDVPALPLTDFILTLRLDPLNKIGVGVVDVNEVRVAAAPPENIIGDGDDPSLAKLVINVSEVARQVHQRLYGREPMPPIDWTDLD